MNVTGDSSLLSEILLVGNRGVIWEKPAGNKSARIGGSLRVFAVIVTQLVAQAG
jgi:hypothetical protein